MEIIKITIPDNLTPDQELLAIAQQLGKKMLPSKNQNLLGAGYELKHLQTAIVINRVTTEKIIVTRVCPICDTIFDHSIGKRLWTNYGGVKKQHHYCSDDCRDVMESIVGDGRSSRSKNKLQPLFKRKHEPI